MAIRENEILKLMYEGWQLGHDGSTRGSGYRVQKGGLGWGGESHTCQGLAVVALVRRKLIRIDGRPSFPTTPYRLTAAGLKEAARLRLCKILKPKETAMAKKKHKVPVRKRPGTPGKTISDPGRAFTGKAMEVGTLSVGLDPAFPSLVVLVKIGSALVHAYEYLSDASHRIDEDELRRLLDDHEVRAWLGAMDARSFLPKLRNTGHRWDLPGANTGAP